MRKPLTTICCCPTFDRPSRRWAAAFAVAVAVLGGGISLPAQIDRHPELESRPVAWTEYDGSYLVDTFSRAEMLNFFWTVFNRPYPAAGWTGSTNPQVPGETAELWRIREYAQLNAYRALNYTQPMSEDETSLGLVQAGAVVLAMNPGRGLSHTIDSSWIGYNETAATAMATSLLGGLDGNTQTGSGRLLQGAADSFVVDYGNDEMVGHRHALLSDGTLEGAVGAAFSNTGYALWHDVLGYSQTDPSYFIAYPAPGFFPIGLMTGGNPLNGNDLRWSFNPATNDRATNSMMEADVAAKINGVSVPVKELVRNLGSTPLTWSFDTSYLDFRTIADGTTVEITVSNVRNVPFGSGQAREYHYTVTFFDENKIVTVPSSPKTPLRNISTRSSIGGGDQQMIAGFSIAGTTPVRVALRTQGPGLAKYGIQNPAQKTRVKVYDLDNRLIGENAGWKQHQDWRLLESLDLAPGSEDEAGMVLTLWPGGYTAVISDDAGANGIGIVEVFNIDNLTPSRLENLSTRAVVGMGEQQMIAGITIRDTPRTVVVRTQGPGLARYGIGNFVPDTVLTIVSQDDGHTVAQNDDWQTDPRNARLGGDLSGFAPTDAREAALVLTLPPGAYTALVTTRTNPGVGIVEVFDVGP